MAFDAASAGWLSGKGLRWYSGQLGGFERMVAAAAPAGVADYPLHGDPQDRGTSPGCLATSSF